MRPFLLAATVFGALLGGAILCLIAGSFLEPTSSLFAVVGSMVWTTFGPFLLVASLVALLTGLGIRAMGSARLGLVVITLAAVDVLGAGYILTRMGMAAGAAGGSVDVAKTFLLGNMDKPEPDVIERVFTIDGNDLEAAIYLPKEADEPAPVITYVHGGGFMTGTFTETAADLRWFADRGWITISVEYRLFEPGRPTWDKAGPDVACALAWVFANAQRLGGDPTRIFLLGDSAGGNLAINVGYSAAAGRTVEACGIPVPVPRAIAVQYPAVDPLSIYEEGFPIPGFEPKMLVEGFIGGPPDEYPDRIAAVSSSAFLTSGAPPTLVILPEKDSLVVAEGTLAFVEGAEAAGIDVDLVRIPFANHVFNQMAANSVGNQIGRTVRLRFLEQFLD